MAAPKRFIDIGTEAHPIWISRLDALIACPWRFLAMEFKWLDDQPGEPAHTGSALARAVELWHNGRSLEEVLERVRVEAFHGARPFPLANMQDVRDMLSAYVADARNARELVVAVEKRCKGEVYPGLWVTGILDQRRVDDTIWDVKSGKWAAPAEYAAQICAYSKLEGCRPGGIIKTRDYTKREPGPVFYALPFDDQDVMTVLRGVAVELDRIRRGEVVARPCLSCRWCAWGGYESCLKALGKVQRSNG